MESLIDNISGNLSQKIGDLQTTVKQKQSQVHSNKVFDEIYEKLEKRINLSIEEIQKNFLLSYKYNETMETSLKTQFREFQALFNKNIDLINDKMLKIPSLEEIRELNLKITSLETSCSQNIKLCNEFLNFNSIKSEPQEVV